MVQVKIHWKGAWKNFLRQYNILPIYWKTINVILKSHISLYIDFTPTEKSNHKKFLLKLKFLKENILIIDLTYLLKHQK